MKLYLQMFAEGAEGAAGAGESTATAGAGDKGFDLAAAIESYDESKKPNKPSFKGDKHKVHQANAETAQTVTAETTPDVPARPSCQDLIKGEYKKDADEHIQSIIKERLKNSKDAEALIKKLSPALDILADTREVKRGDYEALAKSILEDTSVYEDEALKQGVPVESVMQIANLQREADESRERLAQLEAEAKAAQFVSGLVAQSEQMAQKFPGFDLRHEMQTNPEFYNFVTGPAAMSVEQAYKATHFDEILGMTARQVSDQTRSNLSKSLQSGAMRPMESASRPGSQAPQVTMDPSKLTYEQIQDMKKRSRSGENIQF